MIRYNKIWDLLKEREISQYKLINCFGLSRGQLDRLKKNENVTLHTIDVLCNILECNPEDILTHTKDGNNHF
ncbi:MAG: helix-turn-helix transcriptional regulator [Lachnospiraceae bacterium]|jgi:putative transcriptional regulator|nr:helix-turn-helix transcriptional regulator [Lachnospiraceae bacterium]